MEAQRIESSLSQKLHELSELNRRLDEQEREGIDNLYVDAEDPIESEVDASINSVQGLLDRLEGLIADYNGRNTSTLSASERVFVRGLSEIHARETAEFRRLSKAVRHKIDNARLMAGVWQNKDSKDVASVDHLLRERNRFGLELMGCDHIV